MSEEAKNWLSLITDGVLGWAGPGASAETNPADKHKIAGPASAKSVILGQESTMDTYDAAEKQRK